MENVIEWLREARGEIIAGLVLALLGWLYSRYRSFMKMYRLKKKELEHMKAEISEIGATNQEYERLQEALKESEAQRQNAQNQIETLQQELQRKNKAEPEQQPAEEGQQVNEIVKSTLTTLNKLPEVSKYYHPGTVLHRDKLVNILWVMLGGNYISPSISAKLACGLIAYVTNTKSNVAYVDAMKVILISMVLSVINKRTDIKETMSECMKIVNEGMARVTSFGKSDISNLLKEKQITDDTLLALFKSNNVNEITACLIDFQQTATRFVNSVQQNPFKW